MVPRSDFPITTSSNRQYINALRRDDSIDPWFPSPDDEKPSITVTIAKEDTPIGLFEITETKNVKKVTVTVFNQNDEPVGIL